MSRSPASSLRWLTLAVLLPLLVLAALAWMGTRSQLKTAWTDAREEAGRLAADQAKLFSLELLNRTGKIPVFPDPPVPGRPSPADLILDGTDPAALLALRDNPDAGTSPAGLPRRVLAALRLLELDPQAQRATDIIHLVTQEEPSVLTAVALGKIEPGKTWQVPRWQRGEQALAILRQHPDGGWLIGPGVRRLVAARGVAELAPRGAEPQREKNAKTADEAKSREDPQSQNISIPASRTEQAPRKYRRQQAARTPGSADDGGPPPLTTTSLWWISPNKNTLRYLSPEDVLDALHAGAATLPRWATVRLSLDGEVIGPSFKDQTLLATAKVPVGSGLNLEIVAGSPALIEAPVRRQAAWMSALLGVALIASLTGLFAIQRVVARERRLGELKSQFVSSVSHELRAPVGAIRLMAEALQAGKVAKPGTFHTLIAREGERLSHLIENVLDFSRIEEGRKRYHFEESDLAALLRDAIAPMEPVAAERGITLTTRLAECTATVDPAAIQQALVNLLDNAIKFSPEDSEIRITLESTPTEWTLSVTDRGPGIPASEHRSIFERFHRLGDELRRETQGTGIGLSIVQHITDAHCGRIHLTSAPGKGSNFTLSFPRSEP